MQEYIILNRFFPLVNEPVETKALGVPLDNIQFKISSAHLTVSNGSIPSACIIFQTFQFEICSVCLPFQLLRKS